MYLKTLGSPWIRRSSSSKVVDFGTNRNCVCDFLLVRPSNFGPILHRFGYIAGFFVLLSDPTHIPPQFCGCSHVGPCWGQPEQSIKIFGREIIFEVFQPM